MARRCDKCGRFTKAGDLFYGPIDFCPVCFMAGMELSRSPREFDDWLRKQAELIYARR